MKADRVVELERIATAYHSNDEIPDKFIEELCQEHCCDWLETLIDASDRVIELGYGDGITLKRLVKKADIYTVVEGAPSLAQKVRETYPQVELVENLFEDHQPASAVDKILALHVLEHVDEPVALLEHIKTWLKPKGEIIIVVPNSESLHRRLAVLMKIAPQLDTLSPRDHLVGHQRVYDLARLTADLNAAGFEVIESRGFFLKTLPNGMMLTYSSELIKALNVLGDALPVEMSANLALRARVAR